MKLRDFFKLNLKKEPNETKMDYDFTIKCIIDESGSINLTKTEESDGRI